MGEIATCHAVKLFLRRCQRNKLSAATLRAYQYVLLRFARTSPLLPTDPDHIDAYLDSLANLSAATIQHHHRHLRAFYAHVAARLGAPNPMTTVEQPRRAKQLPKALSAAQVKRLLALDLSRRDRALLTLLLDTGIRLGELASLTWDEIDTNHITVCGKTGRRPVPLSQAARTALVGVDLPWRGFDSTEALTTNGIYQVVKRALRQAGIPGGGPHSLRHTFAVHYISAGGDVASLQAILGHTTPATTLIYLRMITPQVAAQHAKYSRLVNG